MKISSNILLLIVLLTFLTIVIITSYFYDMINLPFLLISGIILVVCIAILTVGYAFFKNVEEYAIINKEDKKIEQIKRQKLKSRPHKHSNHIVKKIEDILDKNNPKDGGSIDTGGVFDSLDPEVKKEEVIKDEEIDTDDDDDEGDGRPPSGPSLSITLEESQIDFHQGRQGLQEQFQEQEQQNQTQQQAPFQ